MAAKKKSKKKSAKKSPAKTTRKPSAPSKKSAKKKSSRKTAATKPAATRAAKKRKAPTKSVTARKSSTRTELLGSRKVPSSSGDADSQGLSNVELADSESVTELIDEGNTFEAGVVSGVERADDSDEKEVRTREFSEDDVPQEYLDEE